MHYYSCHCSVQRTTMKQYISLHQHDYYSLLDGLNSPAEYVEVAKEFGMGAMAQTNHGSLSGHREFQEACKAGGIKPLLGVELYWTEDRFDRRPVAKRDDNTSLYSHLTVIAKDQAGLTNLHRMSRESWQTGYYHKNRADTELLAENAGGLTVLSGCMGGPISKAIERHDYLSAYSLAHKFKEIFGDDFYMEVQAHNPEHLNHWLLRIGDELGIKPVATTDCHFTRPELRWVEEAMLILSTSPKRDKDATYATTKHIKDIWERYNALYPERPISFEDIDVYMMNYTELSDAFSRVGIDREDIYENSLAIAEQVSDYDYHENLDLLPIVAKTPNDTLQSAVMEGLKSRGVRYSPKYLDRAAHELQVIKDKNFATYFLIVKDMIEQGKQQGILFGPGRGSSAGSLICYALGITEVDPIEHNLLFERFLDPSRDDWPDVDTDIAKSRRGDVKDYLTDKYGHVASISNFIYFKDKGVVRDAARVFAVPIGEVNKALEQVETWEDFLHSHTTREFRDKYPEVVELADNLRGRIRSVGLHAAGLITSSRPIEEVAPIETRSDPNDKVSGRLPVVAWDMNQAASAGFIKLDLLGLNTLDVIQDTIDMIGMTQQEVYSLDMTDRRVYEELSAGHSVGVFQADAKPYRSLLMEMGVDNFEELSASNALVRPGARNTIGDSFIRRKHGKEPVRKIHPIVDSILEETYGLCIHEDQEVLTGRGPIPIKEVREGDVVPGEGGVGRVSRVWRSGRSKGVVKVMLSNGRSFVSTPDHPVLTEDGFIPVRDVGDRLVAISNRPMESPIGSVVDNRDRAIVLAGLIAEGHLPKNSSFTFANNDPGLRGAFSTSARNSFNNILTKEYFATRCWYIGVSKKDRHLHGYHTPNEIKKWIRSMGLEGSNSHTKFVPNEVFSWSLDDRAAFLGMYISCDGHISRNTVRIRTVSERLATGLSDLLVGMGITNRIAKDSSGWTVFLLDHAAYKKTIAPHIIGRKKGIAVDAPSRGVLCPLRWRSAWEESGMTLHEFASRHGVAVSSLQKSSRMSTSSAAKLGARYDNSWASIESIEEFGVADVFDMTVERTHSFVVGSAIVHNCVFQEQIMRIAQELGGLTGGEANKLRKIMGKKLAVSEWKPYHDKFIEGASRHIDKQQAEELWSNFEEFSGYGFNKSHAVAYSMLTYITAWLKINHPREYMTALFRNEGDKDKRVEVLIEMRRLGLDVLLPNINESSAHTSIQDGSVRLGLTDIKYISDKVFAKIDKHRPFKTYQQLLDVATTKGSGISTRTVGALNAVGACRFIGGPDGDTGNYYEYLGIPKFKSNLDPAVEEHIDDIATFNEEDVFIIKGLVKGIKRNKPDSKTKWARVEILDETGTCGVFHKPTTDIEIGNMYVFLIARNRIMDYVQIDDVSQQTPSAFVQALYGADVPPGKVLVLAVEKRTTKAKQMMATIVVMNDAGEMRGAMVFPRLYSSVSTMLRPGGVAKVQMKRLDDGGLMVARMER